MERRHFQWPWTTPNLAFKVTPFFDTEYLTNGYRYGHSYYRRRIGNRIQAFEWHQLQCNSVGSTSGERKCKMPGCAGLRDAMWFDSKTYIETRTKAENFVKIVQTSDPWGTNLWPKFEILIVLGAVFPHFCPNKRKIEFHVYRGNVSPNLFFDYWVRTIPAWLRYAQVCQ